METVITTTTPDPAQLRVAMVSSLTAGGHLRTPEIINAFSETERHLFLPGTGLEAAYVEWDRDYGNQAPPPGLRLVPAAHRDLLTAADPRFIIDKPASRLVIDWRR